MNLFDSTVSIQQNFFQILLSNSHYKSILYVGIISSLNIRTRAQTEVYKTDYLEKNSGGTSRWLLKYNPLT